MNIFKKAPEKQTKAFHTSACSAVSEVLCCYLEISQELEAKTFLFKIYPEENQFIAESLLIISIQFCCMPDFLVVFNVVALEIIIKGKWVTTAVHW